MKNIELTKEKTLVSKITEIAKKSNFKAFLVGSQLDKNKPSKDVNIIGVMDNQSFKSNFGFSYIDIQRHFMNSDYSNMGIIAYISVVKQIEIELRFTSMMNVTFALMDDESFDYDLPNERIDNN